MLKHLPEFEGRLANIAANQLKEFFTQEPPRRNMPVLLKKLIPVNPLVFVGLILLVVGIAIFIILNIVTKSTDSMFTIVLMTAIGFVLLIWGLLRFRKWRSILCNGRIGTARITGIRTLPMRCNGQIFYHVLLHTETEDGNTDELKALVNGRIIQHFFDIFDAKEQQNRLDVIYKPKCKSAILPLALIYSAKYVYREYMAQNLNN